jgi:hypothetical protein
MPLPLPRLKDDEDEDEDEEHNALLRRALPLVAVVPNASDISVAQCVFLWRVSLSYPLFFFFRFSREKTTSFFLRSRKKKYPREN